MMYVSYIVHISNCGDAYVFFDPLGSSESVLASDSQTLALHNGCQEVVSKGGLDRFARPTRSSITLTFNTLGVNNKNHHLSRGSEPLNARQYVTGKISLCQGVKKITEGHIPRDSAYKTEEKHTAEIFLLIKTRHNVADYHRIIKFVIGGMEIVVAECRERH